MTRASNSLRDRIAIALLALALLARVLIPAGWMPAEGRGMTITLCSGSGAVAAWVDTDGKIQKHDPAKGAMPDHPCAFAGLGLPMLAGDLPAAPQLAPVAREELAGLGIAPAAIGRGLAAPPPPATGPPASI